MRDAVRLAFPGYTVGHEGRCKVMYLDSEGIVSSGIGFAFLRPSDALELGWLRGDLQPASPSDVTNEWRQVESLQGMRGQSWKAFLVVTHLRATDASIDDLFARKLAQAELAMMGAFPAWSTWCADAQMAALSYCWAMGTAWPSKFPHCSAMLNAGQWDEVLKDDPSTGRRYCEMRLPPSANASLRARRDEAITMLCNAAVASIEGLDPAVLHWPQALM